MTTNPPADAGKLVEALEWYADQVAGCRKISSEGDIARAALDGDGGHRAREALIVSPALLDLLAAQASQIEALTKERDETRSIVRDIHWMAQRYADGRKSYAVGHFNDAIDKAKGWLNDIKHARDGMQIDYRTIEERATAAEAKAAKMREALLLAWPHVLSQARAESMLDGFGQKKRRPIDAILELVDAALDQEERP